MQFHMHNLSLPPSLFHSYHETRPDQSGHKNLWNFYEATSKSLLEIEFTYSRIVSATSRYPVVAADAIWSEDFNMLQRNLLFSLGTT